MPLYDYCCPQGHLFEQMATIAERERQNCPACGLLSEKKDQINAGGYKVWPREVEDVLYQHESVREAAVVGVPDAYRGETVKAFVSLRPGKTATAEELISFCRSQMAAYKYPRQIEFLDELPKTVSGKLLRRELRARD